MLNWDKLETSAVGPTATGRVVGKWAPIRVRPYLQSDDLFTVGIVFKQRRKARLTTALLEDLSSFSCLYGAAGSEQFHWLLEGVRGALDLLGVGAADLGPHVSLGDWRHAEGESATAIVKSMFDAVVVIRGKQQKNVLAKSVGTYGLNTPQIRRRVARALTDASPQNARQIWHPNGFERSINGQVERLDLPLWAGQNLFQPDAFGTVISTCYHEEAYRGFFLNGAFRDLSVMYDLWSAKGLGGLFILRPKVAPPELQKMIDNDIDRVGALLDQRNAIVEIDDDAAKLCEKVIAFMQ